MNAAELVKLGALPISEQAQHLIARLAAPVKSGPFLPFVRLSRCCGAARQSRHSLQPQNRGSCELAGCGAKPQFAKLSDPSKPSHAVAL